MNAKPLPRRAIAALSLGLTSFATAATTYAPWSYVLPTQINSITTGDLGGAGPDVVITRRFGLVEVYRNQGGCPGLGPFATPFPVAIIPAVSPRDAVIADYDADGLNDILVADPGAGGVALYKRLAGYVFAPPVILSTAAGFDAIQILAGDWNDDGILDIAVLCDGLGTSGATIELQRGGPPGTFTADPAFTVALAPKRPLRFASGCFDSGLTGANDRPDFAVSLDDDTVRVTRNNSSLALLALVSAPTLTLPPGSDPRGIAVADFDGNGYDDIATANFGTDDVAIFSHDGWKVGFPGTMSFTGPTLVSVVNGDGPTAITRGDLDCDGDQDLALVCQSSGGSMHCLWNQGGFSTAGQLRMNDASMPSDIETTDLDQNEELDLITCALSGPDYVKIFCNEHPPGRCCHIFKAGVDDAYSTSALPVPEYSCPRPALAAYRSGLPAPAREFDEGAADRHFAHSFTDLPGAIVSARLIADVRNSAGNGNDGFHIGFDNAGGNHFLHAELLRARYAPGTGTAQFVIDLAALPGGLNLLPNLNATRVLDVYCQDDTEIDFLRLELQTCCAGAAPDLPYDHSPLVRGQVSTFRVVNGPPFGIGVLIVGTQLGCAGFPPPFQNICLLPLTTVIVFPLGPNGSGLLSVGIPFGLPSCLPIHTQALSLDSNGVLRGSCTITDYLH